MFVAFKSFRSQLGRRSTQKQKRTKLRLFEMETLNYIRKFNELEKVHYRLHHGFTDLKSKLKLELSASCHLDKLELKLNAILSEKASIRCLFEMPDTTLQEINQIERKELMDELIKNTTYNQIGRDKLDQFESKDLSNFYLNLKTAQEDIDLLIQINGLVQNMFTDIQIRNELGRLSKDDFETIADIEEQLMASSEALELHQNIISALTFKNN